MENKKSSWKALLPILVFLVLYIGTSIIFKDFYVMSVVVAFLIAIIVSIIQQRKISFDSKLEIMARGIADKNIVCMILIFLLSGIFAGILGRTSASSAANLLLKYIPARFAPVIIFIVAAFVSTAMGTSCGTIVVVGPIACSIAGESNLSLGLLMACVIGGAMFGDNLSFISDTTIAANTTQESDPKKKFLDNFKMAIPAAIVTLVILFVFAFKTDDISYTAQDINLWLLLPYVLVLVLSMFGINVFIVLGVGIVVGIITQLSMGTGVKDILINMNNGAGGMFETILVAILVAMLSALMKNGGGFDAILSSIKKVSKGKKGAQLGVAGLVSLMDIATANNTVAIVMAAPLAKEIGNEYEICNERIASVMDIFGSVFQGLIPYGAQMLYALAIISSSYNEGVITEMIGVLDILKYNYYLYLLALSALLFICLTNSKEKTK